MLLFVCLFVVLLLLLFFVGGGVVLFLGVRGGCNAFRSSFPKCSFKSKITAT